MRNFIRSHGYQDRMSRKKYFVSEVNMKKDQFQNSSIISNTIRHCFKINLVL